MPGAPSAYFNRWAQQQQQLQQQQQQQQQQHFVFTKLQGSSTTSKRLRASFMYQTLNNAGCWLTQWAAWLCCAAVCRLPQRRVLTLNLELPESWLVEPVMALHDFDNLRLADVHEQVSLTQLLLSCSLF
jgi:hypothetical protein